MTTRNINDLLPNTAAVHQGPLTVGAAAATLLSLISGTAWNIATDVVVVSVETDQIRICPGGTTPTSTKGFLIDAGQMFTLTRQEADLAKVIRVTNDAALQVAEYKNR